MKKWLTIGRRKKVIWSKAAQIAFQKYFDFIKEDSLQSAIEVKTEILLITKSLAQSPARYPLDKYSKNNNGDIRAFEKYNLRVAYQIKDKEIVILRVRHTRRSPLEVESTTY